MIRSRTIPLAIAALAFAACRGSGANEGGPPEMPPVFVETAVVEPEALRETAKLVGQLEAEESVVLRPEIDGVVEQILFDEGARVEEGTVLVRLRDAQQKAELASARARAALAADTHRRFRELAEQEVTSAWELERVTRELEVARAEVERAEVALERTRIRAPFAGRLGARSISPGDRVSPETNLVPIHATDRLRLIMPIPERYASLAEVRCLTPSIAIS
jgi:membrane fusion protein, multidrug efflux system